MKAGSKTAESEDLYAQLPSEMLEEVILKLNVKSFMGEYDVQLVSRSWQKLVLSNRHRLPKATKSNLLAGSISKHDVLSILRDKGTRESLTREQMLYLISLNDELLDGLKNHLSKPHYFEMALQNSDFALRFYSNLDKVDDYFLLFQLAVIQSVIAEKIYADDFFLKKMSSQHLYNLCKHRSVFEKVKNNPAHRQLLGSLYLSLEEAFRKTEIVEVNEKKYPKLNWKYIVYDFFIINSITEGLSIQMEKLAQWAVDFLNPEENNLTQADFYFAIAQFAVGPFFNAPFPFRFDVRDLARRGDAGWKCLFKLLESDKLNQHLTAFDLHFLLQESQKAGQIILNKPFLFNKLDLNQKYNIYRCCFQFAKTGLEKYRRDFSNMQKVHLYLLCKQYPALYVEMRKDTELDYALQMYKDELEKNSELYNKIIDLVNTQWADLENENRSTLKY